MQRVLFSYKVLIFSGLLRVGAQRVLRADPAQGRRAATLPGWGEPSLLQVSSFNRSKKWQKVYS